MNILRAGERRLLALMDAIEGQAWGPLATLALLAAVVAPRTLLEVAVPRNPVFAGLAAFVHYPLAYAAPFLALSLTLAVFARRAPARVARLMNVAWILTALPPLADLLLHRAAEKPAIGYLLADPSELGRIALRFFDPRVPLVGTTPGIRIEALAAVLLGALYVFLRTRRPLRAVGCAVAVYFVSFFFFALPTLVAGAFRVLNPRLALDDVLRGEGVFFRTVGDETPDCASILWLLPLLALLFAFWKRAERNAAPADRWFGERRAIHDAPAQAAANGDAADATARPEQLSAAANGDASWGTARPVAPQAAANGDASWGTAGPEALQAAAPTLIAALWAGVAAARALHMPAGPLVWAPFDALAFLGATLAILFVVAAARRAARGSAAAETAFLAAGALLAALALGRAPSLGLAVTAAALVPFACRVIPAARRGLAAAILFPIAACGAFVAGYALVVGPEAAARLPLAAAGFALAAGLAAGAFAAVEAPRPAWLPIAAWSAAFTLGALLSGTPILIVAALPAGAVAGVVLLGAQSGLGPRRGRLVGALALGLCLFGLTRAATIVEPRAAELRRAAQFVPRLDVLRGQALEGKNDWKSALAAYQRALETDPTYVPALRARGLGRLRFDKDVAKALPDLERAVALAPDSAPDLANLGGAYLHAERAAEALPLLDRAARLAPERPQTLFNRAQALEALGRRGEAADGWRAYIDAAAAIPAEASDVAEARARLAALAQ